MNRILVVGVPRSGSTWLAQMLASTPHSYAVLEPDNPAWHREAGAVRQLYGAFPVLQAGERAPEYERLWDRAFGERPPRRLLGGSHRNMVLKTVHGGFAVDWLSARYAPRVVLIERHPLNVVASWMQHRFEVGDLATRERVRTQYVEPLALPRWDPMAPRILQVAWAVGVLMSGLRRQARSRPEWVVVSHEELCVDSSVRLRGVAARLDLEWSPGAERRLRESNAPGSGAEIKRVARALPSKWRDSAAGDMQAVADYLRRFRELQQWFEPAGDASDRVPRAPSTNGSQGPALATPTVTAAEAPLAAAAATSLPGDDPAVLRARDGFAPRRAALLQRIESVAARPGDEPEQPASHRAALRYLAFYLPQYHPIPQNDAWWGEGFTDWTNVTNAQPSFSGHYQPHLPSEDLGFYDLRDPETRFLQAQLASRYGVDGFVYYHYWFLGQRLLERPFDAVLASGRPELPFCVCWANENWTRNWDGGDGSLLIEQRYDSADDVDHIRWLASAFADARYIRVDGRPLLLVYRAARLPFPQRTADVWRSEAMRLGVGEPYLCSVESFAEERADPRALGFDASVEFPAGLAGWPRRGPQLVLPPGTAKRGGAEGTATGAQLRAFSYPVASELALTRPAPEYKRFRCVTPGWDNSPRHPAQPTVFVGSTPETYERWLSRTAAEFTPYSAGENLVFVNAWNEWGESNHLEPDRRWGYAYLEAHLRATGRVAA